MVFHNYAGIASAGVFPRSKNQRRRWAAGPALRRVLRGIFRKSSLRQEQLLWLAVLGLALLARLVAVFAFADVDPATAQIWEYGDIARLSLEQGRIVSQVTAPDGSVSIYPTAFMPPLMVFVWMGLFSLFGVSKLALSVMVGLNVILSVAIVALTMRIARALFGSHRVGALAGLIIAVHPVFAFSAVTFHAVQLYTVPFLVVLDLFLSRKDDSRWSCVVAGLVTGIGILARTEYLFLLGGVHAARFLGRRLRVAPALLVLAGAAAVVAPWTLRNYLVFHRVFPVANSSGFNLFKGFNPLSNGSGDWVEQNHVGDRLLAERLATVPPGDDYESKRDGVYRDAALAFMRDNPLASFVVLPLKKLVLFWLYDYHDPITHRWLYQLSFWPFFIFSLGGLAAAGKSGRLRRPGHDLVAVLFFFQTIVMMAYAVHCRYRMNVEPILAGYAGYGLLLAWRHLAQTTVWRRPWSALPGANTMVPSAGGDR